jgi:hypothetical protein
MGKSDEPPSATKFSPIKTSGMAQELLVPGRGARKSNLARTDQKEKIN